MQKNIHKFVQNVKKQYLIEVFQHLGKNDIELALLVLNVKKLLMEILLKKMSSLFMKFVIKNPFLKNALFANKFAMEIS